MVRLTLDDGVAEITLAAPDSSNGLGETMVVAIADAFASVVRNQDIRAVVLDADGDTFSAGAPRELLLRLTRGDVHPSDILLPKVLLDCPVPVIAAMEGHATGGGFALGLAADLILLAADSRYGFTFMNMGFTPGMGTTVLCEHVLSPALAHELLYTGELRRGAEFARTGVNYVLPRPLVRSRAFDLAARIAGKPRGAVEALKRTLSLPRRRAFEHSITTESLMHQITLRAPDTLQRIKDDYVE